MSGTRPRLRSLGVDGVAPALRAAGVSGAGGGGFPTYAKWTDLAEASYLLVNHQESEPNCCVDRWLGRERADALAELFDALLAVALDVVVVGAKRRDRDPWVAPLEEATDATVYEPGDLPVDPASESGVVVAYTDDTYEYGMENVLLQTVADVVIGKDLPVDYGWIVQNTETLHNVHRALTENRPVLDTYVHVDGVLGGGERVPNRLFEAPVGTSAADLLAAAGVDPDLGDGRVLAAGGPGWCFELQRPPDRWGVRKRTNCVLVLPADAVADNTYGNGRVNVLDAFEWPRPGSAVSPRRRHPDRVHVPVVTDDDYDGVAPSRPTVGLGDTVDRGDVVAEPASGDERFSVAHHAPLAGEVVDVTRREVELRRTD